MPVKKAARNSAERTRLTPKDARIAAKAAKKAYAKKGPRPAAWKRGGREWSKVLGHFSLPSHATSKR